MKAAQLRIGLKAARTHQSYDTHYATTWNPAVSSMVDLFNMFFDSRFLIPFRFESIPLVNPSVLKHIDLEGEFN